ncbi:MAG TPA: SpoIIE family protein phosphatase [Thermomicrobiales bacterium]|nr:SpoIIE family protein phosphatase [Thermomicrobiales bacterium]
MTSASRRRLEASVSIQKVGKYASGESGDTAEVVERAGGGFSVVLVDGQGSGRGAKALSLLISSRAVTMLKDGVRDRAAVEGVHDFLLAYRNGLVSATIDIVTIDPARRIIRLTRQASVPAVIGDEEGYRLLPCPSGPIGRWQATPLWCHEIVMAEGLRLVVATDGIPCAGIRRGTAGFDVTSFLNASHPDEDDAATIATAVLDEAIRSDGDKPADDLTVVAVTVHAGQQRHSRRMMALNVPI